MNNRFTDKIVAIDESFMQRTELKILQVNLGNMCNQRCIHCHVNAHPRGNKIMPRRIIGDIVTFLKKAPGLTLDVTGGCPELNPNFKYLLEQAKPFAQKIMVRNNLTIFFEQDFIDLPRYYKDNQIELICSLPCYTEENVDRQRGRGVFAKSIRALKILNELGYGKERRLRLDLVYNPGGAFLPAAQFELEKEYKKILYREHGIVFNNLLTMSNVPINRFEQYLRADGRFDKYMKLLIDNFNQDTAAEIMCRRLLSVGWDGIVYDCDFNQMLGLAVRDEVGGIMEIGRLSPQALKGKKIIFENHCFCCTAGSGSSCAGALKKKAERDR